MEVRLQGVSGISGMDALGRTYVFTGFARGRTWENMMDILKEYVALLGGLLRGVPTPRGVALSIWLSINL